MNSIWRQIYLHLKQYSGLYLLTFLGLALRFWRYDNYLAFTWDQGRDAWMITKIASGDFTLIGPTSGLPGFFLGPLWYYAGVPGGILTNFNPYGISLWYILLGSTSLPIFWLISEKLFPNYQDKVWKWLLSISLIFSVGSIEGSIFIWNPLISLPLVSGGLYALLRARQSRWWLSLSFLLWALTLQSEFAYAVFFIVPLFILIPWIRQRRDWRDFLTAGLAIGVTLVPQLLFELRNGFIMSKSLFASLLDQEKNIGWLHLWRKRPEELWWATQEILFPSGDVYKLLTLAIITLVGLAVVLIWLHNRQKTKLVDWPSQVYYWQIISLLVVIPYVFYLVWRGNYGNFFSYYLTPHFIFILPLLIFALRWLSEKVTSKIGRLVACLVILAIFVSVGDFMAKRIINEPSRSGLTTMIRAVETMYAWQTESTVPLENTAFRIFTPNGQTEHYDYLIHWYAKKNDLAIPSTIKNEQTKIWYILIEPDRQAWEGRFLPWYQEATKYGQLLKATDVGDLRLEAWSKTN